MDEVDGEKGGWWRCLKREKCLVVRNMNTQVNMVLTT